MMGLVDGVGSWAWVADPAPGFAARPALFIDRDGVLARDTTFVREPAEVVLLPRAAETVAAFNRARIPVIVVTNQSGVARGILSWSDFEAVEAEIRRQLWCVAGASLDAVFACGFHETGTGKLGVAGHPWRKPNPGMILAAARRFGVRLDRSWIVGDRERDLASGRAAGLAGGLHVAVAGGDDSERRAALSLAAANFEVWPAADLGAALPLRSVMSSERHSGSREPKDGSCV